MAFKRTRKGKTTFYARYRKPDGKWTEESAENGNYPNTMAGAERLETKRKEQVASGTFEWRDVNNRPTVEQWLDHWSDRRSGRNKEDERSQLRNHIIGRTVDGRRFGSLYLDECTNKVVRKLVIEFFADKAVSLSPKSRRNIKGNVRLMFQAAVNEDLLPSNPCALNRGEVPRLNRKPQRIYDKDEANRLMAIPGLESIVWMAFTIMAFTGERVGEACGHKWSDWVQGPKPLSALLLERKYRGAPLKGDTDKERPRMIPVHTELERALKWWRAMWAEVYRREPQPSDPIVANPYGLTHFTKCSAYQRFRRRFEVAGAMDQWKAHHAMRRTFVTQLRRSHPRRDIVNKVTHNPTGDIIDVYTQWEWEPLCEVVSTLPLVVTFPAVLLVSSSRKGRGPRDRYGIKLVSDTQSNPGSIPGASTPRLRNPAQFAQSKTENDHRDFSGDLEIGTTRGSIREFGPRRAALALPVVLAELLLRGAAANDITQEEFRERSLEWFRTRKVAA